MLARIAEGDQSAFRALFMHWHQLLAGYVLRITESREMTEEIVQDVFMKIWTVRETMPSIRHFKHFLLVVSRNRAYDIMKKQLREAACRRAWEKAYVPEPTLTEQEHELFRLSLIDQAIESLPPRRKEVFLLSRGERLTYQEIAARLNISRESVKTHVKLASLAISGFIRSNIIEAALLFCMLSNTF